MATASRWSERTGWEEPLLRLIDGEATATSGQSRRRRLGDAPLWATRPDRARPDGVLAPSDCRIAAHRLARAGPRPATSRCVRDRAGELASGGYAPRLLEPAHQGVGAPFSDLDDGRCDFSGGIRAIASSPAARDYDVLRLDEPDTSSTCPASAGFMRASCQPQEMLFVSHDRELWQRPRRRSCRRSQGACTHAGVSPATTARQARLETGSTRVVVLGLAQELEIGRRDARRLRSAKLSHRASRREQVAQFSNARCSRARSRTAHRSFSAVPPAAGVGGPPTELHGCRPVRLERWYGERVAVRGGTVRHSHSWVLGGDRLSQQRRRSPRSPAWTGLFNIPRAPDGWANALQILHDNA